MYVTFMSRRDNIILFVSILEIWVQSIKKYKTNKDIEQKMNEIEMNGNFLPANDLIYMEIDK